MTASASAKAAHPRVTARRNGVARAAGHRRLQALTAGALATAVVVTGLVLAHSSLFSVRHVVVEGATRTPTAAIVAAAGLNAHPPLLDVGGANAAAVEALPWIASARLERHFPDAVTITVTEHTAAVVARLPSGARDLLDASGRVLERLAPHSRVPAGLVPVTVASALPAPGGYVRGTTAALVRAADALPVRLEADVVSLTVSGDLGIVARLRDGAVAELGTATGLGAKYVGLATLLANGALVAGVVADLRVPSSPVLNP